MQFNSLTFLVFFAFVLLLHNLPFSWRAKKFNLLWTSYIFYAAWNPPFVLLLIFATILDWFAARGLYQARTEKGRKMWLAATLISNLGLLGFFKYGDFLLKNFTVLVTMLGIEYDPPRFSIILPIGISFYTFVTLSYTLDVYFRKIKPWDSFLDYAMLVTFFPHLVAGPILRAADFLPQCITPCKPTRNQFFWGLSLLVFGLFQKIILSDYFLAPIADLVYDSVGNVGMVDSWLGTMAFAGQIYCDFAGYSTCAIGVALCLGFRFPQNFNSPYASVGFSDFWSRWHISLSSWLRDYLYIPLGGNRQGRVRTYVNLLTTMLLGGLWHGASWTFVVWGGLHGIYLTAERFMQELGWNALNLWKSGLGRVVLAVLTYALVCVTWVFFRANTFDQAFHLVSSMAGAQDLFWNQLISQGQAIKVLGITGLMLAMQWHFRGVTLEDAVTRVPSWLRTPVFAAMLVFICVMPKNNYAFIYFQF